MAGTEQELGSSRVRVSCSGIIRPQTEMSLPETMSSQKNGKAIWGKSHGGFVYCCMNYTGNLMTVLAWGLWMAGCQVAGCQVAPTTVDEPMAYTEPSAHPTGDTLFRVAAGDAEGVGQPCGYCNQAGDTLVPLGAYYPCFTDTLTTFGVVADTAATRPPRLWGIDVQGNRLYEVYWYDNGPDYLSEGRFRIIRHGKIGYADSLGRIVIEPQYACAFPFYQGKARVAYRCRDIAAPEDEHRQMESEAWFVIDREGREVDAP